MPTSPKLLDLGLSLHLSKLPSTCGHHILGNITTVNNSSNCGPVTTLLEDLLNC